jgi:hypothetical protein
MGWIWRLDLKWSAKEAKGEPKATNMEPKGTTTAPNGNEKTKKTMLPGDTAAPV